MRVIPILISLLLLLPGVSFAQDLLSDAQELLTHLEILSDTIADMDRQRMAAEQVLTIFYNYDEQMQAEELDSLSICGLVERINDNALLQQLLTERQDSILRKLNQLPVAGPAAASFGMEGRQGKQPALFDQGAMSPLEYLSVNQALKRTKSPPIADSVLLLATAKKASPARKQPILNQQAILEGTLSFLLERGRQEIIVIYLEKLVGKRMPRFNELFYNTTSRYDYHSINYSQSFLGGLRESLYQDLQNLAFAFPQMLVRDDYFKDIQAEPLLYGLITIYSIYYLVNQELPLTEVLQVTRRDLSRKYDNASRNVNVLLADSAYRDDNFQKLILTADTLAKQFNDIYAKTIRLRNSVRQQNENTNTSQPRPGEIFFQYEDVVFSPDKKLELDLLPALLRGYLATDKILSDFNTIERYDQLFEKEYNVSQRRQAALDVLRNMSVQQWSNGLTLSQILHQWYDQLVEYYHDSQAWRNTVSPPEASELLDELDAQRADLRQVIGDSYTFWLGYRPKKGSVDTTDLQALLLLEKIAEDFTDIDVEADDDVENLDLRRERLQQLEARLAVIDDRLRERHIIVGDASPYQQYLNRPVRGNPYDEILNHIRKFDAQVLRVDTLLRYLDTHYAKKENDIRRSISPLLQLTELSAHLFNSLQAPNRASSFFTPNDLNEQLRRPPLRAAFFGLLQQRLAKVKGVGAIAPEALAQLTSNFLQGMVELSPDSVTVIDTLPPGRPMMGGAGRGLRQSQVVEILPTGEQLVERSIKKKPTAYQKLNFAVNTLNNFLTYPLFNTPQNPSTYTSLVSRDSSLKRLPEVSRQSMDMLYYLDNKQHRPAVSSFIRLLTTFAHLVEERSKPEAGTALEKALRDTLAMQADRRKAVIKFFDNYGDFMAGLVDANTQYEMKYLLESIADPPGSSRVKRNNDVTVGINAYLGVSFGRERWRRVDGEPEEEVFWPVRPSVPIGITASRLFWRQSFSVHLSLLDLGAMLTYEPSLASNFGQSKVSFKNVFTPGVQLHWNIRKSPFYLGLGWQRGVVFREDKDGELPVRYNRFPFLVFGVDVPIKLLYRN